MEGVRRRSSVTTSSEEGRENVSGTPNSFTETDVESSSTIGVTEGNPYQCSFCELAFPRQSYLKKHEQIHSDQLPFRCDFCGRHFKHKRSRDRHVKLHTGDKKYRCSQCEAAFSRSDHLKIHQKTHDTQKPYRCSICFRGYSTTAALTAHMQNHKTKASPVSFEHLLQDVAGVGGGGGCDPALISRLIQDSSGGTNVEKRLELISKANNSEEKGQHHQPHEELLQQQFYQQKEGEERPHHLQQQHHLHHNSKQRQALTSAEDRPSSSTCEYPGLSPSNCKLEGAQERPSSLSNNSSGTSTSGILKAEASPTASSPSSRPASVVASPRPHPLTPSNLFLSLSGGKLVCPFCSCDNFLSFESFQLHLQSHHGSSIGNEILGLTSLPSFRPSTFFSPLVSPLGAAGSSRQVTCELCGVRVNGVTSLQRHVITAHSFTDLLARAAEGVFCAQCLLPFSNPGALTEHIKLVHTAPTPSLVPTLSLLSGVLSKRPSSPSREKPTDLSKKPRRENILRELPSSTLLCSQCDAPFSDFESFRSHLKTHLEGQEGIGTFVCPECQASVSSESALESHVASHFESTLTEYGCHACMKAFSKPDELQKHLLDMHAHHLYRCSLCRQVFDSKVSIQVHFAVKHSNEIKLYKCLKCSVKFCSQPEFESHIREVHLKWGDMNSHNGLPPSSNDINSLSPKSKLNNAANLGVSGFRCLLCPVSLSTEVEMNAHIATHEKQFKCSLCDEAFHVEFLLDRHVQSAHVNELNGSHSDSAHKQSMNDPNIHVNSLDLRCGICDTHFTSESALNIHRKQAHNVKCSSAKVSATSLSLFCAYCNEICKSRVDLEAHMKSAHVGATGGRHKCNICDEMFPSAPTLAHHKLSHVKVLSGSAYCVVCRGQLVTAEQVKAHQRDHYQKPLPQPCVVCRQTLVADIEVKVHAKFHTMTTHALETENEAHPSISNEISLNQEFHLLSKCSECHLKFETAEEANNHLCQRPSEAKDFDDSRLSVRNFHDKKQYGGTSMRSVAEKRDAKDKSSTRTYQCIKCQESFDSEGDIEAHVTSHLEQEGSTHYCHLCRSYFDSPLKLQCHLIEHTFEGCGSFTCYICGSVFTTSSRLQQHMVTHGLSSKPYDCHHCRQSFFFRSELENHLPNHSEYAEGCHDCQGMFSKTLHSRNMVFDHVGNQLPPCVLLLAHNSNGVTSHTPSTINPVEVKVPENVAVVKISTLHNLTHEGGKPYLCCECGAPFTRRCEAARHPSVHRDQNKRICTICRQDFHSSSEAQTHVGTNHCGQDKEIVRPDSRCSSCEGDLDSSDSSQNLP
ncbi:Zinc finger protein [Armadillidium vulgare]|nr:Zinc finger protein [Armadillidium vulgare]